MCGIGNVTYFYHQVYADRCLAKWGWGDGKVGSQRNARSRWKITPAMGDWSSWSSCSVSCGEGTKSRTRTCDGPEKVCNGDRKQVQGCNLTDCTTTSTTTTPEITTSTTTLPDLGLIPDGHPDYNILMHKPSHCSGLWTEWSDHTGLDDTNNQCSSPVSIDVREKTYKHDWRVTGNVLVHFLDGQWFFGISDKDFRQGFTKWLTPSILLVDQFCSYLVPQYLCPTVNFHDESQLIQNPSFECFDQLQKEVFPDRFISCKQMEKRYCCANGLIAKRKRRQSNIQSVFTSPTLATIRRKSVEECNGSWSRWWSQDTPNDLVRAHIKRVISRYKNKIMRSPIKIAL